MCLPNVFFFFSSQKSNMLYKKNLEYYSAMRNEAILPFATTSIGLEFIISEIRETEKDKCHMISLLCGILKNPDSLKTESKRWLPGDVGRGEMRVTV